MGISYFSLLSYKWRQSISQHGVRPPCGILNFDIVVVGHGPLAPTTTLLKFKIPDGGQTSSNSFDMLQLQNFVIQQRLIDFKGGTYDILNFFYSFLIFFTGVCVQNFAKLDNSVSSCSQKCFFEYAARPPSSLIFCS